MVAFLGACSVLSFAIMLFGLASIASDIQIIIAVVGGTSGAVLAGLATILHRLPAGSPADRTKQPKDPYA